MAEQVQSQASIPQQGPGSLLLKSLENQDLMLTLAWSTGSILEGETAPTPQGH